MKKTEFYNIDTCFQFCL